jgi:abortive infection bacteriophage resistance protein
MGNIATNFGDQIKRLEDRGMQIDCEKEKIKEILLDIGYYRLGFYWNPFEKNRNHDFKEGTKFSDAVTLYYLDVDLRNILLKCLNRIEINFRTKLVYYVSNVHKTSPNWFIDPKVIHTDFINSIEQHYNEDFIKNNKTIKLHHKKYINDKYAPAWKTLEFFTFGAILKVFKSLNDSALQERIANLYGIKNLQKFINLMETIVYVRNVCAHGGVLFDLKLPKSISAIPDINFNSQNRCSLDDSIKVVLFILSKISDNRKNDIEKQLDDLFLKHFDNEIIKDIIEREIGYKKIGK